MLSGQLTGLAFWKPLCSRDTLTHYLELCLANLKFKSSAMPVNSQLVGLLPVVILDLLKFHSDYLFQFCAQPHYNQHSYK